MLRCPKTVLLVLMLAGTAHAQDTDLTDQQTIRLLSQQVKELQEKFAALEAKQNQATPASVPAEPAPNQLTEPADSSLDHNSILQEIRGIQLHAVHGIKWRGFGELNYKVLDQRQPELGTFGFVPGSAGNFYSGDFDLFLTSKISEKASVLAEIVFGQGDAQSFSIDMERILFKYDHNDHLKLSFGRYHTGIGYYNTAFPSGKWLQTTADRPLVMEFANDGGLLPTQAIGVSATGSIPSGKWGLNYLAEYGSSDTIRPDLKTGHDADSTGLAFDENNGNHVNVGLFLRPDFAPGLQVGASIYHDRISDFLKGPSVRLGQTIVNAHVVYKERGIEFLNEGFLLRNTYEQGGSVYNMPAFYSQISRRFGNFRPFFRYQYVNANTKSIYHDDVQLRHGPTFGVSYDFNESFAIKTQLDHTIRKELNDLNTLQLQLVFAF